MRSGGPAGASDIADHIAGRDSLSDTASDLALMSVIDLIAVILLDDDTVAVAPVFSGVDNFAVAAGLDGRAGACADIQSLMSRSGSEYRMDSISEQRRNIVDAVKRPSPAGA